MDNLIGFVGYALQWARGFPQFAEYWVFPIVVAAGVAGTRYIFGVAFGDPTFADQAIANILKIAGGLGLAILSSHSPLQLAPKYNQFDKEKPSA